jgi:hypothetical protein
MNKYRIVDKDLDFYFSCQCLKCKEEFIFYKYDYDSENIRFSYNYCPMCGVKFDGIFDKKNPKYPEPPRNYNEEYTFKDGYCYYSESPRLILYNVFPTGKHRLLANCPINKVIGNKSSSVYMIEKYNRYIKDYVSSKYKLVLVNKANQKVIKEN